MIKSEPFGKYHKIVLAGEKRNAFTWTVVKRLLEIGCDRDVLITNEGPVFSAGLDLSVFLESKDKVLEYLFTIHRLVKKLLGCSGRTVVLVKGDVYGFGVEVLYFVDYVVASSDAFRFSLQGVNFGVFPPYTVALGRRLFNYGHLRVMLSRDFTAREAAVFGIVSEIGDFQPNRLFQPPDYLELVRPRRWLLEVVDEAVPFLYRLAEVGTREETRERVRKFLGKA